METVQNVCTNVWRHTDDIRFEACSIGAIVLGEKLVGLSKRQSQRKRGSVALCDTRGKFDQLLRKNIIFSRTTFLPILRSMRRLAMISVALPKQMNLLKVC